jgi:cytochrome c oxidase subunit 2
MSVRKIGAAVSAMLMILFGAATAFADELPRLGLPKPWGLGLQEAGSPIKAQMESFHDLLLVIITAITVFVLLLLLYVVLRFNARANPTPSRTTHHTLLEVLWTVLPVVILVVIAVPSFKVLYYGERVPDAELTVKVTGHQWYWSYEYPDNDNVAFDSRLVPEAELKPGQPRLLETDNHLVLPVGTVVRFQVTAADVIHSFAMPSLGFKKDAVPGRLNETWTKINHEGLYYGQCSEICGTDHGFMPITIEAVSKERFAEWVKEAKVKFAANDKGNTSGAPATQVAAAGSVQ